MVVITEDIAKLGENLNFIAFMAHAGYAFFCMAMFTLHLHFYLIPSLGFLTASAVLKEFWFDLKYETNPPQTWKDSALDFIGYGTGIAAGAWLLPWRIL